MADTESKTVLQKLIAGTLLLSEHKQPPEKTIAVDCEMVGVGDGKQSQLARVSIVDFNGVVILDTFVSPTMQVVDYRTSISGVRKSDLDNGRPFLDVKRFAEQLFRDTIVVGHALDNDMKALAIEHPSQKLRDTADLGTKLNGGYTPSLKNLVRCGLQVAIQNGEHSSVQDARAAMAIYRLYRTNWDEPLGVGTSATRVYMPFHGEDDWRAQDEFEDLFLYEDGDEYDDSWDDLQACDMEFYGNSESD